MRKILIGFLFILFVSTSCTSIKYIPFEGVSKIDYSYLKERGVYVSESSYTDFAYEPISSIILESREGKITVRGKKMIGGNDDVYKSKEKIKIEINPEVDGVRRLYEELQDIGADGIINLKIKILAPYPISSAVYYGPGYAISGMAIKRK